MISKIPYLKKYFLFFGFSIAHSIGLLFMWVMLFSENGFSQQIPLGLYEGLLGNTGTALFDTSAPSRYNPSLLRRKSPHSFTFGGNTFGTSEAKNENSQWTSLTLMPSYLSTQFSSQNLVHEIFFQNQFSGELKSKNTTLLLENNDPNNFENSILDIHLQNFRFGYSMAWKSIPFALQYLGRFSQRQDFGIIESISPQTAEYPFAHLESEKRVLSISIGISTHLTFDGYMLGFNGISRGLKIYEKSEGSLKKYNHSEHQFQLDSQLPKRFYSDLSIYLPDSGNLFSIGHGFQNGAHSFNFDTVFVEKADQMDSYSTQQTFGYKLKSSHEHQYLVGFNHKIGNEIKYLGQDFFISTGYSWRTQQSRSSVGLYIAQSDISYQKNRSVGVTFSSEFINLDEDLN